MNSAKCIARVHCACVVVHHAHCAYMEVEKEIAFRFHLVRCSFSNDFTWRCTCNDITFYRFIFGYLNYVVDTDRTIFFCFGIFSSFFSVVSTEKLDASNCVTAHWNSCPHLRHCTQSHVFLVFFRLFFFLLCPFR